MGDLFWNKIAGVVIGLVLLVMVIREVGGLVVHSERPEGLAYPLDIAELGAPSAAPVAQATDLGLLLANASAAAGERIARRCVSCHTFDEGGARLQGPNLWNIVGEAIAAEEGFNYSGALRSVDGFWDYETLSHYIENPRGFAPGTAMAFAGIRSETDRADLLAYMQSMSSAPVPFPAPAPVEAEAPGDADAEAGDLIEVDDPEPHGGREEGQRRESGPDAETGDGAARLEETPEDQPDPAATIVPGVDRPIDQGPVDIDEDDADQDDDAGDEGDEDAGPEGEPQP